VIETGATYTNPRSGGRVTVVESWRDNAGERLTLERVFPSGTGKAGAHYHLDFDQRFDVLAGTATMTVDGERRTLAAGEAIDIPRPTKHADPWNDGTMEMTLRLTITPVPRFVEAYAETWADGFANGRLNAQDELPFLQLLMIAHATDAKSYGAGPPRALRDAIAPIAAAIARQRGYRVLG
jgi:quercetin dioxygenase-like cupin family protein